MEAQRGKRRSEKPRARGSMEGPWPWLLVRREPLDALRARQPDLPPAAGGGKTEGQRQSVRAGGGGCSCAVRCAGTVPGVCGVVGCGLHLEAEGLQDDPRLLAQDTGGCGWC